MASIKYTSITREETTIVPITDLSKAISETKEFTKGAAWGLGMEIKQVGTSLCVSDEDAKRLIEEHKTRSVARRVRADSRKSAVA